MRSMTGFGTAQAVNELLSVELQIRSLNGRYLDIHLSCPPVVYPFEAQLKRRIGEQTRRGKIELQVRVVRTAQIDTFDRERATAVADELRALSQALGLERGPSLADILRIEGVVHPPDRTLDEQQVKPLVNQALEQAIERWNASRRDEGQATLVDIRRHLDRLHAVHATFLARAPELEQTIWQQVRQRFHDLLGDLADEARVYQEAAALLVRYSTQEETARLGAHLASFERTIESDNGGAKRLDFLCQELNREINTTASKTVFVDVQDAAVEGKDAVEAIREQLRNLE